jgi:hypothetical protein
MFIQGWRTFLLNMTIALCTTYISIETKSVEIITAAGVIFVALSGGSLWGKKKASEHALKKGEQDIQLSNGSLGNGTS